MRPRRSTKYQKSKKAPVQTSHMVSSWTSWREQKLVAQCVKITQKVSLHLNFHAKRSPFILLGVTLNFGAKIHY